MLNIIRADLYRIFRGKGIYVTLGFLLLTVFLQLSASGTIGIGTGILQESVEELAVTGANTPFIMMTDIDILLYFLLPVIIFIASSDFSAGTIKNNLASGMSRAKYYAAKLLLAIIFCVLLVSSYIIIPSIIIIFSSGFGGEFNMDYVISVLKPFSMQLLIFAAATSFGVFLVFVTKKTAAVNGLYIAWLFVPLLVLIMLIEGFSENLAFLAEYDITLNIKALANFGARTTEDIIRALAIGIFYITASTIGGIMLFRRSEIK
jgi:ABC-type transport system involved in multi-copper enzyme maturation permease subunit